jgi:hypothetical protein
VGTPLSQETAGFLEQDKGRLPMNKTAVMIFILVFLSGCAGVPIRQALQEDPTVPAGTIEGNRFQGVRYPFHVSVPPSWKMTMEFPDFLERLGYNKPLPTDKEQPELYAYNPETESSIHFDFTPAGPRATFSQEKIMHLTTAATESLIFELDQEHGSGVVKVAVGPTEPVSLKGIQYAAKKRVSYILDGVRREQGWIYGFTEPYQVFILYMILEKEGANDSQVINGIVNAFEVEKKGQ